MELHEENTFSSVAGLNCQSKIPSPAPHKLSCTECGGFTFCTREELRGHLECEHGINIETKELEFDSMEEFLQWKLRLECDEKVFFMKLTGEKMVSSEKSCLYYYTCCRSRTAMKHGLDRKSGESIESDQTCPASLKVLKMSSGRISVKFYMTHTGHSVSMGSLHRPDADTATAAGQIVHDFFRDTELHKEKMFSSVAALNHHKEVHTPAPQELSCTECGVFACHTREELRDHLECEHGINIETKELEFDSMEEFLHWKLKMEGDKKVFFTKLTDEKMVSNEKSCLYYTCNHSRNATKQNLDRKLRESTESGQTCPASLKVSKMSSGKISVKFHMTHTGHKVSIGSLHLPDADTAMVAEQIVHVPSSTDGITLEGGSATTPWQQDLQHRSFGPIIVTVEQNDVMPWQQEVQHISPVQVSVTVEGNGAMQCQEEQQLSTTVPSSTNGITVEESSSTQWQQDLQHGSLGPNIVAVEENYVIAWQQELQQSSPVPVSVIVEENNALLCQGEQQHSTTLPVSVTVEGNDAILCHGEKQHSTTVPVSETVEENDVMPCEEEQHHSTTDFCEYSDSYKALCEICGLSFTFRKALNRHLRALHNMNVDLNEDNEVCDICDKTFSSVAALDHHRKMHTTAPQKLSCTECSVFMCHSREQLRGHLECEHGINMEKKDLEFDSMEQFLQWKRKMEGDEKVFFTKLTDEKLVSSEKSCLYYTCHHSRTSVKRSLGKRLRESTKLGQTCPASLTASKMSSGKISVEFYKTHTGHNSSMESLHLPHTDRAVVADQIVHELNISDGTTAEEDGPTPGDQDLQHRSPGFDSKQCVAVEHSYAL